jgi:lipoprotein-anchoring transpeptidase ErfK/SrfK
LSKTFHSGGLPAMPLAAKFLAALTLFLVGMASFAPGGAFARETVAFPMGFRPGTIVIRKSERRLYFVKGDGVAIRYPVAIGKAGKAWEGETYVQGKYVRPAWSAPDEVRADHPNLTGTIPGGSPRNPMGARALTLGLSEVAIHGTAQSMRRSIGAAASYGCIRMLDEDIIDLYDRVQVGTPVIAVP